MSDSENQGVKWGQWYRRLRDEDFIRARSNPAMSGGTEYQHLDADYLNALEATITTLKAQLEAAEGKAALADEWFGKREYMDADGATHMDVGFDNDEDGVFCAFGCNASPSDVRERRHEPSCILARYDALSAPASDTGSEENQDAG